jgi:flagellar capping protein FliD
MTTNNKAVTCYLPKDIEDFITGYCNKYGITRKDKEGNIYPSLGTGIVELLKLLAYNPELVSSPILDTVPSKFSEDAIEKKIDEILEKKLSNHLPDNVPSIEVVEVVKDRLGNWVLAVDGDIKDVNQKIRDRSLQVDHQIASIKSRLDNMERLLRLQQSALIASPISTGEPSPLPPPSRLAIETVTPEVSPSPP